MDQAKESKIAGVHSYLEAKTFEFDACKGQVTFPPIIVVKKQLELASGERLERDEPDD